MAAFKYAEDVGKSSIAQLEALARSSGVPFRISSAYRPGDPLYHGKHNAIDMVATKVQMRQLAAYLYQYSEYLLELIHSNGNYFVSNGQRLPSMSARIVADHWDHVHLAGTVSGVRAAGQGRAIPATGHAVGCLPRAAMALSFVGTVIGGVQWMM